MTKFSKGARVVAVENIGGFMRPSVPKGSKGVVTDSPMIGDAEVTFKVKDIWSENKVTLRVSDSEIF